MNAELHELLCEHPTMNLVFQPINFGI